MLWSRTGRIALQKLKLYCGYIHTRDTQSHTGDTKIIIWYTASLFNDHEFSPTPNPKVPLVHISRAHTHWTKRWLIFLYNFYLFLLSKDLQTKLWTIVYTLIRMLSLLTMMALSAHAQSGMRRLLPVWKKEMAKYY